jgi:hypothetical protein
MSVRIRLAASIAMTLVRASDDVKKFWARPSRLVFDPVTGELVSE